MIYILSSRKPKMSLQVEKLEKNMAKLTIEASVEDLGKAIEQAYAKNKSKISVPGFRKGKVPLAMVEKMYGVGIFYEEAANQLISEKYPEAAKESGLDIVSRPEVDVIQIEKGQPFIFTATVAVKPEVELGEYKGIEIPKKELEATEEEVNQELDKVRNQNARTITIDDRAVENNDITLIDFEGFCDGVAFQGGKGENQELVIGSGAFIPGFEEQLIGMKVGEEKEIQVKFPEEYHAADLAGKDAMFKVKMNEIKVKELPEADDDFAQDVSDFDTLEEYKADMKKKVEERKARNAKTQKENEVIEKIIENSKMEIPDAMIDTQVRQMADDFARRIQQQGLSVEQYFQFTGLTADKMFEQMRPNAVKHIQTRLVLEAVAKKENIPVSEEEIEKEMEKMASAYQMEIEKLKEFMGDREKEQLKEDIAVQKAIDFVIEAAVET